MEAKLQKVVHRYNEITELLGRQDVASDQVQYRKLSKELSQIEPVVKKNAEFMKIKQELANTEALLKSEKDPEMRTMLIEERDRLNELVPKYNDEIMVMLLPKDPNSGKNIMVEIRAGTGGDEAANFVADLFRMYTRYADNKGWKVELFERSQTEIGGLKEVIFAIYGQGAYDDLKYESGAHRVQRVPTTEASGRIHTSAVTVAVMPEAEEQDVPIRTEDIRVDVFRSSGSGGQHVNTTDSAVRMTHIPTGLVVSCQDEKSQIKNREKALKVLRTRLYELQEAKRRETEAKLRKSQVGSGDRSERIRTYNFPQSRVTDHRIGLTLHSLEYVLNGDMEALVSALKQHEIGELLKSQELV